MRAICILISGVPLPSIPHLPVAVRGGALSLLSDSKGPRWLFATERFNHLCDSAGFKQSRLLQAFPAVTNSEGKGERKLLGPAGFRQAGSRGNKRKPLTNHSIILILSEKRARDG